MGLVVEEEGLGSGEIGEGGVEVLGGGEAREGLGKGRDWEGGGIVMGDGLGSLRDGEGFRRGGEEEGLGRGRG